jgi:glutathione synthase/RimK-type ligase-like ATP-grasp enzyme
VRVAIASFAAVPPQFPDDLMLADAVAARGVEVERIPWDDPATAWDRFDAVVIRSTWDYTRRRDEYVAWAESVGDRLHNSAAIVRWNSDKRYLADLDDAGIPVVDTAFVGPGDPHPDLDDEVVIKPTISAGGRDSGRFGPAAHDVAHALIDSIRASGRRAMVQPFHDSVDTVGERAVLCIDGEPAHTLRKGAVLRPDEVAPIRDDAVGAAETMYDPDLVVPVESSEDELALARRVVAEVARRFDYLPLYARVDMIRDAAGAPVLLELEAIEPNFYLSQVPASAGVVADAVIARAAG